MTDKLGRWPINLLTLMLVIALSAQSQGQPAAPAALHAPLAAPDSGDQGSTTATITTDGRATNVSNSFFGHLDRNVPAVLLITMVGALSTAAGAGGGAMFVPLFNSLLQFSVKDSAAISQAIITGGAVAGASFALFQAHPLRPTEPLIHFDLALLLIPALLLGTSVGVLLNHVFPVWLITLCLVCLLTYLTYKTMNKGLRLYREESRFIADKAELHLVQVDQQAPEEDHHYPVHNLLRSISEEPDEPTKCTSSLPSRLPTIAESGKVSTFRAAESDTAPAKPKEVPLAMMASQGLEASAQSQLSDAVLGKFSQLQRCTSHGSTQSLRISTEADGRPLEDEAWQSDTATAELGRQQSSSSCNALSPTSSSSSINDAAPLLPQAASDVTLQSVLRLPQGMMHHNFSVRTSAVQHEAGQRYCEGLRCLPRLKLLSAVGMWVIFAALQLVKGQLEACSSGYWLAFAVQAGFLASASMFFVSQASREQQDFTSTGLAPQEVCIDQQNMSSSALTRASAIAVAGGALASTIGMGGGVIMGPLLLTLQVHPLATAATSTLMILFSSSAATLSFAVAGDINAEYGLIYAVCNFMASFAGVFVVGRIVRKTGKSAVIVILLGCVMAVGASASAVFGGRDSLQDIRTGTNLTFTSICR